jgi:hypothetical protein
MVGELITLPVRIGVRATRLWLRGAEEAARVAVSATGRLVDTVTSRDSRVEPDWTAASGADVAVPTAEDVAFPAERAASAPASRLPDIGTADDRPGDATEDTDTSAQTTRAERPSEPDQVSPSELDDVSPSEPDHVSEEPVLVDEFAEPGAEEGAGPEVHVDEPWDGYERMNATDIIARLAQCDAAELAAVSLYESGHKGRHTVLAAVERELRSNGTASQIEKERTDA